MEELSLVVTAPMAGLRIDKLVSEETELSRSFVQKLCADGAVCLENGKVLNQKYKVSEGEVLVISIPEPTDIEILPEDIPLSIVYEDKYLLVIDKKQGMVVHPAPGNYTGTVVNALMYHCGDELSGINGVKRPGIVHRIDKDTSGLLVVAKTDEAHLGLAEQWQDNKAKRKYLALVNGNIKEDEGIVDRPIGRNPKDRKKMAVVPGGRRAVTHFNVLERFSGYTLVECILETGRTHQIRVHMQYLNHSIVGDPVYGVKKEKFSLKGQLLHAKTLAFTHPVTGEEMSFESPLPDYFENVLKSLG